MTLDTFIFGGDNVTTTTCPLSVGRWLCVRLRMKLVKTSEIDPTRAFRVFRFIEGLDIMRDNKRVTYAVGSTHISVSDIKLLSRDLPVDILLAQKINVHGLLRLLPIPKPNKFIIKVNDSYCISDLVAKLDLFLLIGIYNFDSKLAPVFVECAKNNSSLEQAIESDCSSFSYVVNFDDGKSSTGVTEYWTYGASLAGALGLYVESTETYKP